jgi:hypothetical protein
MEQFEIKDDRGASLVFYEPQFGADGFIGSYRLRLVNDVLKADIEVDGRRYINFSTGEEEFFSELAASWRGWSGQKMFESLEHDLKMVATSDRTGHVQVHVRLTKFWPNETIASTCIVVYAGQLDDIARGARKFFSQKAVASL